MPENDKYFDPLRRKWVSATPEEKVRQWFISVLQDSCKVPAHMMMSEVPMKYGQKKWRADIVVYSSTGAPLAIVECKRPGVDISAEVAAQALRYHAVQDVRFIILTNGSETYAYRRNADSFEASGELPDYRQMNSR